MSAEQTAVVAPCEKNSAESERKNEKARRRKPTIKRECALEGCGVVFTTTGRKLYCRESHQRIASNRRYRARHTETATCERTGCANTFTRDTTSHHRKVYCSLACQAAARSEEYRTRPDIQAGIAKARAARCPE